VILLKYLSIGLVVLTLSGCTDYSIAEQGVVTSNKRVESVLDGYKVNTAVGKTVESDVLRSLYSKDSRLLLENNKLPKSNRASELLLSNIDALNISVQKAITDNNNIYDLRVKSGAEPNRERINNIEDYIKSNVKVHYFINDSNYKVEQMFMLRLPNGVVSGISLYWLGGVYLESKTFGLN
jgi:hypothetical protein